LMPTLLAAVTITVGAGNRSERALAAQWRTSRLRPSPPRSFFPCESLSRAPGRISKSIQLQREPCTEAAEAE
jgi:hypothetical protein